MCGGGESIGVKNGAYKKNQKEVCIRNAYHVYPYLFSHMSIAVFEGWLWGQYQCGQLCCAMAPHERCPHEWQHVEIIRGQRLAAGAEIPSGHVCIAGTSSGEERLPATI